MSQVSDMQLEMRTVAPLPASNGDAGRVVPESRAEASKAEPFTLLRGETALVLAEKYKLRRDQAIGALQFSLDLLLCVTLCNASPLFLALCCTDHAALSVPILRSHNIEQLICMTGHGCTGSSMC
jgi:hypothetical protein